MPQKIIRSTRSADQKLEPLIKGYVKRSNKVLDTLDTLEIFKRFKEMYFMNKQNNLKYM